MARSTRPRGRAGLTIGIAAGSGAAAHLHLAVVEVGDARFVFDVLTALAQGRWQLAMRQVEVSRTPVFDDPRLVRTVFEELLAGNINLGRPEHVEVIFGARVTRSTPGVFSTRLLNRGDQVTVNLSFKHSRVKIYLKQDHALRVEIVINDPGKAHTFEPTCAR